MRKFLFSMLLLAFLSPLALNAEELIVGETTTSSAVVPFRNIGKCQWVQTIYPSTEIGEAKRIDEIAYNCATVGETTTATIKIYMGETTKYTHANAEDWVQGLTLVYSGTGLTLGDEEWETFVLDTKYNYSGTQNLVVAVSTSLEASNKNQKWNVTTVENIKPSAYNTKNASSDLASAEYPTNTTLLYVYGSRPVVKMTYSTSTEPEQPENPEQPEDPEQPGDNPVVSGDVSFYDDFNDNPNKNSWENWTRIDNDGDGNNWSSTQFGMYSGYEDTYGIYSACYATGVELTPDNYIITKKQYTITSTSALSFLHRETDGELYQENFSVVVSEDGENFEEVWSKKYTEEDIHEYGVWTRDSISLAAYAGKNMYVGFHHYDCNGATAKGIKIDNVRLSTADSDGTENPDDNPEQPEFPDGDAVTVTIGDGGTTSSYYVPINDYYNQFGISQQIYTAEEIGVEYGTIVSLSFKKSNTIASREREVEVYLKNTDQEYYDGTYDWVTLTSDDIAVFEGDITTPNSSGWFTINFTRPFEYTGGNLAVTINDITGGYDGIGDAWASYTTEKARAIYSVDLKEIDHLELDSRNGVLDLDASSDNYMNSQVKLAIVPAEANVNAPESIALGDVMLGEYWSEKASAKVEIKAVNTTITNIAVDNDFFVLPSEMDYTAGEFEISYDKNATAGAKEGNLTITYGAGETKVVPVTATAYEATEPDVFELAKKVAFTEGAFSDTPDFATLHDSYLLPQEKEDGNAPDAVYEVELTDDALVTASVTGEKSMLSVYKSDFSGENGPSVNNYYDGILYTPRSFFYDFNDGTLNGWTLIDNDGNGYNWEIVEENGMKYAKSYAFKTQGEGENKIEIITSADDVMMTEQVYNITANSQLSFDATRFSTGDPAQDNYENIKEYIKVEVSKDGETFTTIEKVLPTAGVFGNIVVDLGAEFEQLGLNYGEYHIALRHQENDGVYVSVDNVRLASVASSKSDAKALDAVHFPAGKYYFIAAAESAFSVNISMQDAPLTPPTEIFVTDVTETTATLSWNAIAKAESYNIYDGETFIANVAETTYTVEELQPYTEYGFVLKSVAADIESFASEEIIVRTKDLVVGMPSNLVAETLSSSEVALTWSAAENALAYNVYLMTDGEDGELLATVNDLAYTVTGLEAYTPYFFAVSAVRNEQESAKTAKVYALTDDLTPGTPKNLVATALSENSIALTWQQGENAKSYKVYRAGEEIAEVTGLLYSDKDLTPETEYCYTVTSVRSGIESDPSDEACATTTEAALEIPAAPANVVATAQSTSEIALSWNAVEGATNYYVYQNGEKVTDVTEMTYKAIGLEYNTEYCFQVTAVNEAGESEKSTEACAKTLGESISENANGFNIYPNPVNDKLYIETEMTVEEVSVYDMFGRQLTTDYGQQTIDVTELNSGIYFVKVVTKNGETVNRFIKK